MSIEKVHAAKFNADERVTVTALRPRVLQALTKSVSGMPMEVNTLLMNAHISSKTLKASGYSRLFLNIPGAVELCKEHMSGVRMLTSWAPTQNVNMREMPTLTLTDSDFSA